MSTDIVAYSRLMEADEMGTLERMRTHRHELWSPLIEKYGGRVVGTAGDALLVEFTSAVAAVESAIEIQVGMAEREADEPGDNKMLLRIGVNIGEVIVDGDDIFGDEVNIAARLQALADPGGISVSGSVQQQIEGKLEGKFADDGLHIVKNISRPIRVWRWSLGISDVSAAENAEAPAPLPDKPVIAVLPFDNMSGDPDQEYFSDGISEDIITDLSKLSGLLVIARNSSFAYKGEAVKVQEVGRDLGVQYVLEGSVRKAGERMRVTAQLVDATNGRQLWAERYDRQLEDIFAVQDELSRKIVTSTAAKLSENDSRRLANRGTNDINAYDQLLHGREQLLRHTREANAEAIEHFERALALDPAYAAAHVHLAESLLQQLQVGWISNAEEFLATALDHATRAIAIDDDYGPGHGVLGQIHLWQKNFDAAVTEGERRVALNPGDAEGIATLAMTLVFSGEPEAALEAIEQAMRLEPQYPFWHLHVVGLCNFALERYGEAAKAFRRSIVRNPNSMPPHMLLAAAAALSNDMQTAHSELAECKRLNPELGLSFLIDQIPYQRAQDVERLAKGLKAAGLEHIRFRRNILH